MATTLSSADDPFYVSASAADDRGDSVAAILDTMTATADFMTTLEPTASDIAEYRGRVTKARVSQSQEVLYNRSAAYATVLIEQLFEAADRDVRIVCRRLNPEPYGSDGVVAAALRFLDKPGARLRILAVTVEDGEDNPLVAAIGGRAGVEIEQQGLTAPFDFLEADGKAYRFEADAEVSVAMASFNDPAFARKLGDLFDRLSVRAAA